MTQRRSKKNTNVAGQLHRFEHLSEDALRTQVLIPLFNKMGFRDVTLNHGTNEKGKDLVMWQENAVGARVNHAVVVKKGPISGKADGSSSSANTTAFQARQCFGSEFSDPVTGAKQYVSVVYIVASGHIKESARESILAGLDSSYRSQVYFIDGEKLAKDVDQYLPTASVAKTSLQLQEAVRRINSDDYKLNLQVTDDVVQVQVSPKQHGTELSGLSIVLPSPDTPHGVAAVENLALHSRTGAGVTLTRDMFVGVKFPDALQGLANEFGTGPVEIKIGPKRGQQTSLFGVEIEAQDGISVVLGPFRCQVIQYGAEEVTVESIDNVGGWSIRFIWDVKASRINFSFSAKLRDLNVRSQLIGLRALYAFAVGARVVIKEVESGIVLGMSDIAPGTIEDPPDPDFIKVLEAIEVIQQETGKRFSVPLDQLIEADKATDIVRIATLLRGSIEIPFRDVKFGVPLQTAKNILERFEDGSSEPIAHSRRLRLQLFGADLDIGVEETILPNVLMTAENLLELRKSIEENSSNITICLTSVGKDQVATLRLIRNSDVPDET